MCAEGTRPVVAAEPLVNWKRSSLGYPGVALVGIALGAFPLAFSLLPPKWLPLFVLGALFPIVGAIVGNIRKLLLAAMILDIPLNLDVHLGFRPEMAAQGAIGGLGISVSTIALALLYVLWLVTSLTESEPRPKPELRVFGPAALYLAVVLASLFVAQDLFLGFIEVALLVQMFLMYVYIVYHMRTREDLLFVVSLLLLGLLVEGLLVIGVYLTRLDLTFPPFSTQVDPTYTTGDTYRPGGTLGSPNTAGGYFSLLLAPAAGILLTKLRPAYKWLAAFGIAFGCVALLLTLSRGGWLAFAFSISLFGVLAWRQGWLAPVVPVLLCLVLALMIALVPSMLLTRLTTDPDNAAYSRISLMQIASRMIEDHPFLGVGANNFAIAMPKYSRLGFSWDWAYTVHNKYLLVWAENGIGGLLAFLLFLFTVARRGWHACRLGDPLLSRLALGLTAGLAGHMIHMALDVFHDRPHVQLFWLIAGLLAAMVNLGRNPEGSSHAPAHHAEIKSASNSR